MEHHQHGMAKKWRRHYPETRTVFAMACILFGTSFMIPLLGLWPQVFSAEVFNTRLAYHSIIDAEDYWTCDKDIKDFLIDEPTTDEALYSMYIFNVSLPNEVYQNGYKPELNELGPYGYTKNTYKYDIDFPDPENSLTVAFKEYTLLDPITDQETCERMFRRQERGAAAIVDPCLDGACYCRNHSEVVTAVNPLFLKMMWEETPEELLSLYALQVFINIRAMLQDPFTDAVKQYLVFEAITEIGLFRQWMQTGTLLQVALANITETYTFDEAVLMVESVDWYRLVPDHCGLEVYGLDSCPFTAFPELFFEGKIRPTDEYENITDSDFPSISILLNESSSISYLNKSVGLPHWLATCVYLEIMDFNYQLGFTTLADAQMAEWYEEIAYGLAVASFGEEAVADRKEYELAAKLRINGICEWLNDDFIVKLAKTTLLTMNYAEFTQTYDPVICAPDLTTCTWQWGYMMEYRNYTKVMSDELTGYLIDIVTAVDSNPVSFFYKQNSGPFFNTYRYCGAVSQVDGDVDRTCMDDQLDFAEYDADTLVPAALWAADEGIGTVNMTYALLAYKFLASTSTKASYSTFACGLSQLLFDVYMSTSPFHDVFVIKYLNRNKDPTFEHEFTLGQWDELGLAQFGGGFVTHALLSVRALSQVVRDGMWRFGDSSYVDKDVEVSTWMTDAGYPSLWIYNVTDAGDLLDALASDGDYGRELRRHIVYRGSTFFGDGENYVNGVGDVGEILYIVENHEGNFSCGGNELNQKACALLEIVGTSSAEDCATVQALFTDCSTEVFYGNSWITDCTLFETTVSSPSDGIQCDSVEVYGEPHPYSIKMGNVIHGMIYSMTIDLVVKNGLVCDTITGCSFDWGGLFTTAEVKQFFFEGVTDPAVIRYLEEKHRADNVSFECALDPFDECGDISYRCDTAAGIVMHLPNGQNKSLSYTLTPKDEFFAPYFLITTAGDMLWPFSSNVTEVERANAVMATDGWESWVVQVRNPYFALYPAWHTTDIEFNKFYQCQHRTLGGPPFMFNSCVSTIYSGRKEKNNALDLQFFYGNDTIYHFAEGKSFAVNGSNVESSQLFPASSWGGFTSYSYAYQGLTAGQDFRDLERPVIFNKQHSIPLQLSQDEFTFLWEMDFDVNIPMLPAEYRLDNEPMTTQRFPIRRFTESAATWDGLRSLATPNDSYGMPFDVPIGMASLHELAGFPVYIGTTHFYGNEEWGGSEYAQVYGMVPDQEAQRSVIDFDPVTGRALRTSVRQQVHFRIERNVLFQNIFSSQGRCNPPTHDFSGASGYGCFTYVPILWYEDTRIISTADFLHNEIHYYKRPERAGLLGVIGVSVGVTFIVFGVFLYIYEAHHRRKFYGRIYVD